MSDTSTTKAKQATNEAEIDNSNRSTTPQSDKFLDYIMSGWAPSDDTLPAVRESAAYAAGRRTRLGAQFVGKRLVIAAGAMKISAVFSSLRPAELRVESFGVLPVFLTDCWMAFVLTRFPLVGIASALNQDDGLAVLARTLHE